MKRILPILVLIVVLGVLVSACAEKSARDRMMSRYDYIQPSQALLSMPAEVQQTILDYNEGRYHNAAVGFDIILKNPEWRALHESAQYYFTESLYRLGLYQACQYELTKILFKGPDQTSYFTSALIKLLAITYETHDETVVFAVLSNIPLEKFPKKFRNELIYLVGKMYFYQNSFDEAYTKFNQLDEQSAFYAKALYFKGIIEVKRKEYEKAEETFALIQQIPNVAVAFGESRKVKEMSKLAVGQLFYAAAHDASPDQKEEIFRAAINYYDQVDRDNPQWFESQFEKTWAATMIGRFGIALGSSLTLSSPFFEDRFVPEIQLIEAITWYTLCKYSQARDTLDRFFTVYGDMHFRIQLYLKMVRGQSSDEIYDNMLSQYIAYNKGGEDTYLALPDDPDETERLISSYVPGEGSIEQKARAFAEGMNFDAFGTADTQVVLPIQILTHVLNQQRFVNFFSHVKELKYEFSLLAKAPKSFKNSSFSESTVKKMNRQQFNIKKKAGKWVSAELSSLENMLAQLLGNASNIDFELTDAERKRLEEEARYGVEFKARIDTEESKLLSPATPDSYQFWSFDGEYWQDELGYYIMAVEQECQ